MNGTDMFTSLPQSLRILLSSQEKASFMWRCLTDNQQLFIDGLRQIISRTDASGGNFNVLQDCWDSVSDGGFRERLIYIFHEKRAEEFVDANRLARNAKTLVATAGVAAGLNGLLRGRTSSITWLMKWIARCFNAPPAEDFFSETNLRAGLAMSGSADSYLRYFFRSFLIEGQMTLTVRYWSLYWLNQENSLERGNLVVPVVSTSPRHNRPDYGYLHLNMLEEGSISDELVEHPESALLPLGGTLLEGLRRAWQSARGKSICWNLRTSRGARDGDSLSAAAAIGMRLLLEKESYDPSCLILARLNEDLMSLEPVGSEFEKIQEARRQLVRRVVIASSVEGEESRADLTERELVMLGSQGVRLTLARTLQDVSAFISRKSENIFMGNANQLLGRYGIKEQLNQDGLKKTVTAYDDDDVLYLVKLWSYNEGESLLIRALWDNELRNLYRLSSSPGAEASLLTMKDAGIDNEIPAYAVVLRGEEFQKYETLATALGDRSSHYIFQKKSLEDNQIRHMIWKGLRRIAEGINLLHSQDITHRNVGAETVYFDPATGTESWRLGGFEWSLRLGSTPTAGSTQNWSIPPENKTEDGARYTFEGDWYGFGMLAARCFNSMEGYSTFPPHDINRRVLNEIRTTQISEIERALITRLIASDVNNRLTYGHDVVRHLDTILEELADSQTHKRDNAPLVLVIPKQAPWLIDLAEQHGFNPKKSDTFAVVNPDDPDAIVTYNPSSPEHVANLKAFFRDRLDNSRLYAIPGKDFFILDTNFGITLQVVAHQNFRSGEESSWDFAFVAGEGHLGKRSHLEQERLLEGKKFNVVMPPEVSQKLPHESWEQYLPVVSEKRDFRKSLQDFQEFLRCTNQLELLMGAAEIFSVALKGKTESEDGTFEHIVLVETDDRQQPAFARRQGGMADSLQGRIDTNNPNCRLVVLTETDALKLERIAREDAWEIVGNPDRNERTVELKRRKGQGRPAFEKGGYIRSYELYGQFRLLERRKSAIERLERHSYLLRSLVQPGMVRIDTGVINELPFTPDSNEIDDSKSAVLKDILRVRPIYALQGPPGTGKTTLVSYLLREILTQDPVAQILVTAQAHGAVDVLREKVQKQAFKNIKPPLAIRVGLTSDGEEEQEGTIRQVTRELLLEIQKGFSKMDGISQIQQEWIDKLPALLNASTSRAVERHLSDMERLVQLGASITYCTTSSADLEELASGNQSFDWCIVEEAGKAHGFDLALPLQTAHRWLLLGDYKQLPPYRIDDFKEGLKQLDSATSALEAIPGRDYSLVDYDWIDEWRVRSAVPEKAKYFENYSLNWLNTFARISGNLSQLVPANELEDEGESKIDNVTTTFSKGAWAGQLTAQYRMHPTIGDLISDTFYDKTVANKTVDENGRPTALVTHSLIEPGELESKSIIWLDTKWSKDFPEFSEFGPEKGKPRYTNLQEIKAIRAFLNNARMKTALPNPLQVAILSPYAQQVSAINKEFRDFAPPQGLEFRQSIMGRRRPGQDNRIRSAHTVDSFQGNQADIVIISLVRNNTRDRDRQPLGFLDNPQRINVLLSRAERLLVLVGSWDFFTNAVQYVNDFDPLADWKNIISFLSNAFDSGSAVKIPYDRIISNQSEVEEFSGRLI